MKLAFLVLVACGSAPPPPPALPPVAPPPSSGIRPEDTAGLYWLPYVTCADCATPTAIVAYLTPDERLARTIRGGLDGKLPFGLPYVVHTDELGIAPRGIAIVTGTFGTREDAERVAAASPAIGGVRPAAIAIDPNAAKAETPRHVTVVDRGKAVQAWSKADVDAVKASLDASTDPAAHATLGSQHAWVVRQLATRPPLCTVLPGDLFVVEDSELDWYELAPVHCGDAIAYISWTSSLLGHAVIVPRGAGHALSQVIGAECDRAIVRQWRYDREGRHDDAAPPRVLVAANGAC